MDYDSEIMGKEAGVPDLRFWRDCGKLMGNLGQDRWSVSQILNLGPPRHEGGLLNT